MEPSDGIRLSSFFDTVDFVLLQGVGEFSGDFHKVIRSSGKFFISDNQNKSGIFVFNELGEYLKKIGVAGRGPGEFISMSDFAVDNNNGTVHIYDIATRSVLVYAIETGLFIQKIPTNIIAREFELLPSGKYLFYVDETFKSLTGEKVNAGVLLIDPNGNYISTIYTADAEKLKAAINPNNFFSRTSENEVWFCDIDKGKLILIREERAVKEVIIESLNTDQAKSELIRGIISFLVCQDKIFCFLSSDQEGQHAFMYDLQSGYVEAGIAVVDDISGILNRPKFSREGTWGFITEQQLFLDPEVFSKARKEASNFGITVTYRPEYDYVVKSNLDSVTGILKIFHSKPKVKQ